MPLDDFLLLYGDIVNTGENRDICETCKCNSWCNWYGDAFGYNDKGEPICILCNSYEE